MALLNFVVPCKLVQNMLAEFFVCFDFLGIFILVLVVTPASEC